MCRDVNGGNGKLPATLLEETPVCKYESMTDRCSEVECLLEEVSECHHPHIKTNMKTLVFYKQHNSLQTCQDNNTIPAKFGPNVMLRF